VLACAEVDSGCFPPNPAKELLGAEGGAASVFSLDEPKVGAAVGAGAGVSFFCPNPAKRLVDDGLVAAAPPKSVELWVGALGVDPNRLGFSVVGVDVSLAAALLAGKLKAGALVSAGF